MPGVVDLSLFCDVQMVGSGSNMKTRIPPARLLKAQTAGGGAMVCEIFYRCILGLLVQIECCLNATVYLSID